VVYPRHTHELVVEYQDLTTLAGYLENASNTSAGDTVVQISALVYANRHQ
jgi:hypothetical protein